MEFTEKALELIQKTAQDARAARLLPIPGNPRKMFLDQGGTAQDIPIPPPPIDSRVLSLEDLINYAKECQSAAQMIFHDPATVVLVLDRTDRREKVTLDLGRDRRWLLLDVLNTNPRPMPQKEFIRVLKIELELDPAVVTQFRVLDFHRAETGRGDVQKQRESMGRSVEAAVQGLQELPEELAVMTSIYETAGERAMYAVRLAVEIDAVQSTFQLIPRQWDMLAAMDAHQRTIAQRIRDACDVPVFYGRP